ncbi:hypothetical protein EVAR_28728_1 [Eumeta japonica]|uniref:Uncharacterized protein n=1 Tax=Eumeta variegata TaxID=151549 RepID=A0A4C1V5M5_EUMVA|nr:hypothetical protein EVAR_28728_1 [Eumeta japonica]
MFVGVARRSRRPARPAPRRPTIATYGMKNKMRSAQLKVFINRVNDVAVRRATSCRVNLNVVKCTHGTAIAREALPGIFPGSFILSGGDKFPYRGIGSSRLDCGDEIRHLTRLVPRETKRGLENSVLAL